MNRSSAKQIKRDAPTGVRWIKLKDGRTIAEPVRGGKVGKRAIAAAVKAVVEKRQALSKAS